MLAPCASHLILFGSRARGDAHANSDIDIAIAAKLPVPPDVLANARVCLGESAMPFRVDLVDRARADPARVAVIDREGIPWNA